MCHVAEDAVGAVGSARAPKKAQVPARGPAHGVCSLPMPNVLFLMVFYTLAHSGVEAHLFGAGSAPGPTVSPSHPLLLLLPSAPAAAPAPGAPGPCPPAAPSPADPCCPLDDPVLVTVHTGNSVVPAVKGKP